MIMLLVELISSSFFCVIFKQARRVAAVSAFLFKLGSDDLLSSPNSSIVNMCTANQRLDDSYRS